MKYSCIPGCGLLTVIEDERQSFPTKSVSIDCTIQNILVNITSKSVYLNETGKTLEALFVFPLDEGSAIYFFEAIVDGRRIVSECQEKEEARETYDRAVEEGHTAFLLEEDDRSGDTFRCALGNVHPNSEIVITMKYITKLMSLSMLTDDESQVQPDSNALRLTLPSVLNPRYDPPESKPVRNYWDRNVEYAISSKAYEFKFIAHVEGTKVLETVSSQKDKFVVSFRNKEKTSANVELSSQFNSDHDLVVDFVFNENNEPHIIYELAQSSDESQSVFDSDALMINFLPKIDSSLLTNDPKMEFVFLIDRSGSMSGSNISHAKDSLLLILKSLPMGSRFQIVGFGSSYDSLFNQMVDYNDENLQSALNYQENLEADMGGTEVLAPLKFIYSSRASTGFLRNIVFLTDGDVCNTDEVVSLVAANKFDTRMFAIGLGEGASTALVSGVARAGGGRAEFVKQSKDLRSRVMSIMNSAMEPYINDLKLSWNLPDGVNTVSVPSLIPPVYTGTYLTTFALLSGDLNRITNGSVILTGDLCGVQVKHEIHFNRSKDGKSDPDGAVRRLAAKYQIVEMSYEDTDKIDKKSIIMISTKYNILSKFTSMVAVDPEKKEAVKASDKKVPPPPPMATRHFGLMARSGAPRMMCAPPPPPMMNAMRCAAPLPEMYGGGAMMDCAMDEVDYCMAADDDCSEESDLMCEPIDLEPAKSKSIVDKSAPRTLQLATLQKFDGSWSLDSELCEVIEKDLAKISDAKPDNLSCDCWATILAIVYLETKCTADKTEWMMMVKKARKYLMGQLKDAALVDSSIKTGQSIM